MHNTTTTTRYDFPHWITWQNVSLKMFLLPISTTKKGNVIVHSSNNNVCKYLVKNSCSAFPFNSNQLKNQLGMNEWKAKDSRQKIWMNLELFSHSGKRNSI